MSSISISQTLNDINPGANNQSITKDQTELNRITTIQFNKQVDSKANSYKISSPCTIGATVGVVTANDPDADGINNICDLDDDND